MRLTSHQRRQAAAALAAAGAFALGGAFPAWGQQSPMPQPGGAAGGGQAGQAMPPGQMPPGQTMPHGQRGQTGTETPTGQADQTMKPGKAAGARSRTEQRLTTRELQRHARADVMIEQRAPELQAKLATVKDPSRELSAEEQQKLRQALQGTGYTLQRYSREHRQITSDPQLMSRLQRLEQQVKARMEGGQPAGTSSGTAPQSGGTTSGGGARPGGTATTPGGGAAAPAPGASPR